MITNNYVYIFVILIIKYVVCDEYKSSLTFVIDDTYSMKDDIAAVKNGANAIFDTVLNNHASQIENFILVTFNDIDDDPGLKVRAKTKNRDKFKDAVSAISIMGGGDCPEYSMAGIKLALEESLPASYLYVFTDASAKDYEQFEEIQSIAQKKQSQVTFVLTGICDEGEDSPDYQVYYAVANATSGEVFNVEKQEVGIILDYVKNNVKGRRATLDRRTLPAGTHSFNITVDSKIKDTTVSLASSKRDSPTITVTASDGSKADKKILLETEKSKVYSVNVTKPGNHTVEVVSKSEARVTVTGRSTVNFIHGFSTFMPSSIKDTSTRPVPDVKSHLSIKLTEGEIELITAKVVDMHDNLILEVPLKISNEKEKFYTTEPFDSPKTMFKITITGYDPESKSFITRTAATPVEPQKISPAEKLKNVAPSVNIEGENKIHVEFDKTLQLICNVHAYPKPDIIWKNKDEETIISDKVTIKDLPYDYVSILDIESVKNNATYRCEAINLSGSDAKDVILETKQRFFNVTKTPKRIAMEFQKEGKIHCIVDAYPPVQIAWYKNGRKILPGGYIDLSHDKSILTIKYVTPSDKGKYLCEAWNEDKRQTFSKYVTVVGVDRPIIDKNITEVAVKLGSSTEIECKILSGKPKPYINWFFKTRADSTESISMEEWEDQEKITINNADKSDSGTYECQADNEVNMDSHEIDVIVEYKPTIAEDVKRIKSKVGSEILINCNVDGGPIPHVTWFKDDAKITKTDQMRIFGNQTLKFTAKSSDSGYYTCIATNNAGSATKTVKVDINDPVTITRPEKTNIAVVVGSELRLPCEAKGDPEPEIKWVHQSFSATSQKNIKSKTENLLHLEHIQVNEEGYYTCIASNTGGVTNITYTVQVFAPPTIENMYKDKHFVAVEGDRVLRIACKASGNPKPIITWTKDGMKLALGSTFYNDGDTLVINNVPKDASGVYKCEAENSRGVAQEIYQVSVESSPPLSRTVISSVLIEESIPREIKCNVPHKKIDQLRWYRNGKLIRHGNLVLTNPSEKDSGFYICRVGNFFKSVSGTVSVIVGYKPYFTTYEDEEIEMVEGPPFILNCETNALPKPEVAWYYNGEKLNSTEDQYYFPTGVHNPGQYRCEVTNIFGTINRTFNANPRDCFVNTEKLTKVQPLMITSLGTWPALEKHEKYLIIPKGSQFHLFCPNRFKMFPRDHVVAFCEGGMNILVNGNKYDYSDIQCNEEVTHEIIKTGEKCLPGNTEKVKIVFKLLDYKNVEVYEICLDKTNNVPIYAKNTLPSVTANDDYNTTWFDSDQFRMKFEEAYDCKNQIHTISATLGEWFHYRDECCFSKQQLVNPKDVFPGVAQRSTYSFFNVVPHWGSCNNGNWEEIEQRVRNIPRSSDEILVWTGTAKEISLSTRSNSTTRRFFGDRTGNRQSVPMFLWKVVQDQLARKSLAIVQVNIPDLSPSEVSKYILCEDICGYTDWMKSTSWHDVTRGYTYCCYLDEFEKAFDFKNVFEPFPAALYTTDSFVLPDTGSLAIIA